MEETEVLDFYTHYLFRPSKEEAVMHLLPRLLAGTPHGLIRRADVYGAGREPGDLAAKYPPVPSAAATTGDRFFLTTCRRGKNGRCARGAGNGTWTIQRTEPVYDESGAMVGELRHLSFKKGKVATGWVMEEYRCLLPEAVVADGEMVLCRIHLAQHPPDAARLESNKYKLPQEPAQPAPAPQPAEPVTASAHARKRSAAPVAAADPPCSKKMRIAAPVPAVPAPDEEEYEDCPVWFTPAAPVSMPAAFTEVPEADDDTGRLSCTMEELLGEVQQQQEQTLPAEAQINIEHLAFGEDIDQLVFDQDIDLLDIEELAASIDLESLDLQTLLADDNEKEAEQAVGGMAQEEQTLAVEAESKIDQPVASVNWEVSEELQSLLAEHDEEEAQLYSYGGCYYNATAADLHAPSLGGGNLFFSFGAVN